MQFPEMKQVLYSPKEYGKAHNLLLWRYERVYCLIPVQHSKSLCFIVIANFITSPLLSKDVSDRFSGIKTKTRNQS